MNCLVWVLFLLFVSAWSFGRYFLVKDLLRQKKISENEVSGELVGLPIAVCAIAVATYLYNKYLGGQTTLPDYWYILLALIVAGGFPLSYFFNKGYAAKKCKNCSKVAIYRDDKNGEYCKYCKQPLQGSDILTGRVDR